MKNNASANEANNQDKTVEVDELSKELIREGLLESIGFLEINVDVKLAKKIFRFKGNSEGCRFETSLSLKSLVIMLLAIGGYITKKYF